MEIKKILWPKEKFDLVVMASHGAEGSFRFGSATEKVLKNSPVPVTIIPVEPTGSSAEDTLRLIKGMAHD